MSTDPDDRLLWCLSNASGEELTCELHRCETGVHLRFQTSAGSLRVSKPVDESKVASWARIWRAHYLTNGWFDPRTARCRYRRRKPHASAQRRRSHARANRDPGQGPSGSVQGATGPIIRYWTMPAPEGASVACELVRTEAGLEVRCNTSPERTQVVHSMAEGLDLANAWKSAYQIGYAGDVTSEARQAGSGSR